MENMCDDDVLKFLRESLPGVILTLHDIASKKRHQAKLTLRALCNRVNSDRNLQEALVSTTVACLAGASETIRAGVVHSLGLYAYALEDCEELKVRFIRIVLLLDNHSPQMARSMVKFLRLTIQGIDDPEVLHQCFQYFLRTILGSQVARAACRIRIRTLVEKLGKRFGWDNLEKMIPEAHIKLFRYTRRMYNRRVKSCQAAASRKALRAGNSEDEANADSDMDSSDDEQDEEEICMVENDDKPIDLSSGKIPLMRKRDIRKKPSSNVKMSSDGRLVVEESDNDNDEEEPQPAANARPKRVSLGDLAELRDKTNALKKARVIESVGAAARNGRPISRKQALEADKKSKRNRRKHELIGLTQFAPKKSNSFGDAKGSSTDADPYAYVRLNPSLIREKYRGNALEALSQVVRKTGERASRKKGRNGVQGGIFLQKPVFKKPTQGGKQIRAGALRQKNKK